jgi:putative ABC transport system permease protein
LKKKLSSTRWLLLMAWRDSRRSWGRLLLFASSIIIGVAAMVAIQSFSENLQRDIRRQSRTLLGADMRLESAMPLPDTIAKQVDALGDARTKTVSFVSMALFPKKQATRLVFVQAIDDQYPLYGKLTTNPANALAQFRQGGSPQILVDKTVLLQFALEPGDSVKVGNVMFQIAGEITALPGRPGFAAAVAPVVLIPSEYLQATELLQRGSRVTYTWLLRWDDNAGVNALAEQYRESWKQAAIDVETAQERQEGISQGFRSLGSFLQLVGFVALLLGCIGVASAVKVYIKEKQSTVAILRCLGAAGKQTFQLYVLQVLAVSAASAAIGVALGSALQWLLPLVFADFLPLEDVEIALSWRAALQGWLTGTGMALLFATLPLLAVRHIAPLRILRINVEDDAQTGRLERWILYIAIFAFVAGVAWWQAGAMAALFFTVGSALGLALLAGVAEGLMWTLRRFFPSNWPYPLRQGLANLYRPNNQTLTLLITIGLGTNLLATLFLTRDVLLQQVSLAGGGDRPNMVLFDIQTPQKEGVAKLVSDYKMPLIQQVPIVTMRLESIDGITKAEALADTTDGIRRWVFDREYRVTYRDTLIDSETIKEGTWHGDKPDDGKIYVSVASNVAEDMKVKVGSKMIFSVQGLPMETEVSSIREVDFGRIQTNFLVVFPTSVLEKAPQFHVVITKTGDAEQSAQFQRRLVGDFPNVSVVDLTQILRTVDDVLGKLSFVIRFMALFSILTGLMVLVSALVMSRYQRIRESVLLRTLGATRRQIMLINSVEYLVLGSLAAFTGLLLAVVGAWALSVFQFDIPFTMRWQPPVLLFIAVVGVTLIVGWFNSRSAVNYPPLEVLRREG